MEQILNDAFRVMQQGIAAINAAKTAETGTPATTQRLPAPVSASPAKISMNVLGGIAIAGLVAYLFFKRK